MDPIDRKEPLEAGEDGAFDLGDPSPPPSPPHSRVKVAADDGFMSADDGVKSVIDDVKAVIDDGKSDNDGVKYEYVGVSAVNDGQKSVNDGVKSVNDGVKSGNDECLKADAAVIFDADSPPPSSREIEDDWEKIDVQPDEGGEQALRSPARSTDAALEDFKDAVETLRPHVERTESTESAAEHSSADLPQADSSSTTSRADASTVDGSGLQPSEAVAVGAGVAGPSTARKPRYIAAGLSNVRLPMMWRRSRSVSRSDGGEGSDGEDDFHDAYASAADLVKDAAKAREMKEAGNTHYKSGEFEDAVDYYTMALHYCPENDESQKDMAIYLANRAQAHLRLEEYNKVVDDCTAALELDPHYVKALLRRTQANENLEKFDLALADAKALMEIDPSLRATKDTVTRLEKLQNEKNEKMKEEALGKLKDLGNSLLGNFGMSLDNFKMKQDPESGSYSINFER